MKNRVKISIDGKSLRWLARNRRNIIRSVAAYIDEK